MPEYEIALIIPLAEEYEYFEEVAPPERSVRAGLDIYYEVLTPGQSDPILVAVLGEMGLGNAALAAERIFTRFAVKTIALVGIAGALTDDLLLGDVVVANQVDSYMFAAKATPTESGFALEYAGRVYQAEQALLNLARSFALSPETRDDYEEWRDITATRAPTSRQECENTLVRDRPKVVIGDVASGDIVGSAEAFSRQLLARNRKLVAIEMEAGGIAAAAASSEAGGRFIIIRGISDFADDRKSTLEQQATGETPGDWRRYAMLSASELFLRLIPHLRSEGSPDFGHDPSIKYGPDVLRIGQAACLYRSQEPLALWADAIEVTSYPRCPNPLIRPDRATLERFLVDEPWPQDILAYLRGQLPSERASKDYDLKLRLRTLVEPNPPHQVIRLLVEPQPYWVEEQFNRKLIDKRDARLNALLQRLRRQLYRTYSPGEWKLNFPSALYVEVSLVSNDNRVLLVKKSRRKSDLANAAGLKWSCSVEEGVKWSDLDEDNRLDLHRVVRRGLKEEFGVSDNQLIKANFYAVVLQETHLNSVIAGVATVDLSGDELERRVNSGLYTDYDSGEAIPLRQAVPLLSGTPSADHPRRWHPTALIRLHFAVAEAGEAEWPT